MKTKTIISNITKQDLVNLFATALYGSLYLSAEYDEFVEFDEDDSHEEILAEILLHGGCIYITDHYAEGVRYRDWARLDGKDNAVYPVYITDVYRGLEKAVNGTFNAGENDDATPNWRERNLALARESFFAFANGTARWDWISADCLMQVILFNEIVY